jgi:hypothetical protein
MAFVVMESVEWTMKFFLERAPLCMPKAPTGSCRGFSERGIYHGPFNMPNHIRHHIRYLVPTCGATNKITHIFQSLIRTAAGGHSAYPASLAWVHCVLLGSLRHSVIIQTNSERRPPRSFCSWALFVQRFSHSSSEQDDPSRDTDGPRNQAHESWAEICDKKQQNTRYQKPV